MGQPAAKQGDQIVAVDTHIVVLPGGSQMPLFSKFEGIINGNLSSDVNIMGMPAATVDSTAENDPRHENKEPYIALPSPKQFLIPPNNKGTIKVGSPTVKINGKMAARKDDIAETCNNDPNNLSVGKVVAESTVFIG